jgi:hypothetical protein
MKIKINDKNTAALEAALAKANGNATAHTFRSASDLIERARQAEAKLQSLSLAKCSRSGAIATANSGQSVANAYKYTRITSTVQMVRGSSAWFLIALSTSETYRRTAGDTYVSLTSSQDAEVTATFRSQFGKQPVTTVTAGGAA